MIVLDATQTGGSFFFFLNKAMCQIRMTDICLFRTVSSFVLQNDNSFPKALVKSHEAYWILWQLHPILSAKFEVYIWHSRVFGLKRA